MRGKRSRGDGRPSGVSRLLVYLRLVELPGDVDRLTLPGPCSADNQTVSFQVFEHLLDERSFFVFLVFHLFSFGLRGPSE
jgi:hypothetical protein